MNAELPSLGEGDGVKPSRVFLWGVLLLGIVFYFQKVLETSPPPEEQGRSLDQSSEVSTNIRPRTSESVFQFKQVEPLPLGRDDAVSDEDFRILTRYAQLKTEGYFDRIKRKAGEQYPLTRAAEREAAWGEIAATYPLRYRQILKEEEETNRHRKLSEGFATGKMNGSDAAVAELVAMETSHLEEMLGHSADPEERDELMERLKELQSPEPVFAQ